MADTPFLCGCTEQFGDGTPALKLPTNRPKVLIQGPFPHGLGADTVWVWLREAHSRWGQVCDWMASLITNTNQANEGDYIQLVVFADLGGGGVLADQMLPYTGGNVLRMRINTRIQWQVTDGSMQPGTIDPIRTLCHEIGHFMGHQHWPHGAPPELMEPSIQQGVIRPQPTEAKVSAGWFGQPQVNPPPMPPGSPHTLTFAGGMLTFQGQGTFDGRPF